MQDSEEMGSGFPLITAATNNYFDISTALLDYGANPGVVDQNGMTSLHHAARGGFFELSLMLISRGLDPNTKDYFGNNSSYWAFKNKHGELLTILPPVENMKAAELKEYRDLLDEFRFLLTADEKKKLSKKKK